MLKKQSLCKATISWFCNNNQLLNDAYLILSFKSKFASQFIQKPKL
jgi:hypothetical protein